MPQVFISTLQEVIILYISGQKHVYFNYCVMHFKGVGVKNIFLKGVQP